MGQRAIRLRGESDTAALAAKVAAQLRRGDVVCLTGHLGAGKTAFARAVIRSLAGPETEVPSPTFTLVQTYDTPQGTLWHFDLYRLSDPEEVLELGWDEARHGIILVEWPGRLGQLLPADRLEISLTLAPDFGPTERMAELRAFGTMTERFG